MTVQAPPVVSEQVPTVAVPSEIATVPVGTPSVAVTATVRTSAVPKFDGFAELASVVVELVWSSIEASRSPHQEIERRKKKKTAPCRLRLPSFDASSPSCALSSL